MSLVPGKAGPVTTDRVQIPISAALASRLDEVAARLGELRTEQLVDGMLWASLPPAMTERPPIGKPDGIREPFVWRGRRRF